MLKKQQGPEGQKSLASIFIGGFVKDFIFLKRAIPVLLAVGAFLYFSLIAILYRDQENLIFHPKSNFSENLQLEGYQSEVFSFDSENGKAFGYHFKRADSQNVMIYFYGNADNVANSMSRILWFSKLFNCSLIVVDYPGYGKSEGKPGQASIDIWLKALDQTLLAEFKYHPDQRLVWGLSFGGGVAARMASFYGAQAVILEASFISITKMAYELYPFAPVSWILRHPFPSFETLQNKFSNPVFLIHSIEDLVIDYSHSERMHQQAGWPLLSIKGGHSFGSRPYRKKIAEFLRPQLSAWVLKEVQNP